MPQEPVTPGSRAVRYETGQEVFFADYEHGTVVSGVLLDMKAGSAAVATATGTTRVLDPRQVSPDWLSAVARY